MIKKLIYRKTNSFESIKDIDPKFGKHKLKTRMKIVLKFIVPIFYAFPEISHQRALRSGRVESGRAGPGRSGSLF